MPDLTTPAAIARNYDAIRYDALPHAASHPDNLAAVATIFGLAPPPVASARVLEIGCNDGSNLLPMAALLPEARLVGFDISESAIATARETASALRLRNIEFHVTDLTAFADGTFDYIIANGVYSWVPPAVRDALLAIVARTLGANGLAFVSYNTYPGGFVRRAAWDALHWHVDALQSESERLAAARELAELLGDSGAVGEASDAATRAEFKRIAAESDSALYHDTLARPNDPVWFHEFVDHANQHGLSYVAEALPSMMAGTGLSPRMRQFLAAQSRLAREQYLDFARMRRFRQSIVCKREAAGDFVPAPRKLLPMHVSASMTLMRAAAEARIPATTGADGAVLRALLARLLDVAPASLPTTQLIERLRSEPMSRPVDAILLDAWSTGLVLAHVHPPRIATVAGERPVAFAIARWQASRGEHVTNLRHELVRLTDASARRLLPLCDGSRDRSQLSAALRASGDWGSSHSLDDALALFARFALLER
ncbi:MAG TPA: methyltransferase regulatory domain-containing protein [Casimicrobiaceae bacterium]|nr:methyltransferase regulatory domain-containing protein [Casimicrobiaceae bacterium]